MKLFADLISQHAPDDVAKFLDKWLSNTDDSLIGDKAKDLLVNFTEECQYKIRTNSGEIFFQQEGVYDRLRNPVDTVESSDAHEPVGPFRILKSYIKEGMHPYLTDDSADGFKRNKPIDEFASYADMVKTSLSLIPNVFPFIDATAKDSLIKYVKDRRVAFSHANPDSFQDNIPLYINVTIWMRMFLMAMVLKYCGVPANVLYTALSKNNEYGHIAKHMPLLLQSESQQS